ncbi:DOMON-like domain-containing protein [Streptomyces sp. NPDC020965]|uniref:DOMON-like domain-containing protein n=1 Tax=Streptomyces sp. NPDC020965 TaxID=3365105 RepID=UPI00379804B0
MRRLDVRVEERTPGILSLRYVLDAELSRLRIPAPRIPRHTDGLWKRTCFEMFVRRASGSLSYYELNSSPSTEWALYSFDDYHTHMARVSPIQSPQVRVTRDPHRLCLDIRVDLRGLAHAGELALAAVIEDDHGSLGYWALEHPGPRPDFHHPGGFRLRP